MNPSKTFKALSSTTFAPTTTTPQPYFLVYQVIYTCRDCITRETFEIEEKNNEGKYKKIGEYYDEYSCKQEMDRQDCEAIPTCVLKKLNCCEALEKIKTDKIEPNRLYVPRYLKEIESLNKRKQELIFEWDNNFIEKYGKPLHDTFKTIPLTYYYSLAYKNQDGVEKPKKYSEVLKDVKAKISFNSDIINDLKNKNISKEKQIILDAARVNKENLENFKKVLTEIGENEYENYFLEKSLKNKIIKIDDDIREINDNLSGVYVGFSKYIGQYLLAKLNCDVSKIGDEYTPEEKKRVISDYIRDYLYKDVDKAKLLFEKNEKDFNYKKDFNYDRILPNIYLEKLINPKFDRK